jgi:hypothetical protein
MVLVHSPIQQFDSSLPNDLVVHHQQLIWHIVDLTHQQQEVDLTHLFDPLN